MPYASQLTAELLPQSETIPPQPPQVALLLDQGEDPSQLIAILEQERIRFYRFKASTQELNEIQVDPDTDSLDRTLDPIVTPLDVEELRKCICDAVQMVLLVNSRRRGHISVVLDSIRKTRESNGHILAYGAGEIGLAPRRAWLMADERNVIEGTSTFGGYGKAARVFDDLDEIRKHFSQSTGWVASEDQPGPIENFWEEVPQVLEGVRRAEIWRKVMEPFWSWLKEKDRALFNTLNLWRSGGIKNGLETTSTFPLRSAAENAHIEGLAEARHYMVAKMFVEHMFANIRTDEDFIRYWLDLTDTEDVQETPNNLLQLTLNLLVVDDGTTQVLNDELLRKVRVLLEKEDVHVDDIRPTPDVPLAPKQDLWTILSKLKNLFF